MCTMPGKWKPGSLSRRLRIITDSLFNSFVLSGTAGAVIYAVLCKIWPVQVYPTGQHSSERDGWEKMVPTEGFFHDDETMPEYIKDKVLLGEEPITAVGSEEENVRHKGLEEKNSSPRSG